MRTILIPHPTDGISLRRAMLIPLALIIASIVLSCHSYSDAKRSITEDLNDAIIALANDNSALWTRQDTIAALRQMHETTHKPLIYQASDVNFRNGTLKDTAYFTLALVDGKNGAPEIGGHKIASDSVMLVPGEASDGLAIRVQGFADCSMASVFAASDQTLPGALLAIAILSTACMLARRRKGYAPAASLIDNVKLTPMQRRLAGMLIDAPDKKLDKQALCAALWGNKSNAEESLYTLVRRTKAALADAGLEIVCHRGNSYEIRVKN